jgi:hypothetical protein
MLRSFYHCWQLREFAVAVNFREGRLPSDDGGTHHDGSSYQ